MHSRSRFWDIVPGRLRISNEEARILEVIVKRDGGNAYSLWKASEARHYPTVLRSLKKLKEKGLVEASGTKGVRNEKIYVPTFTGTLYLYILKGEEEKIVEILKKSSTRFRELYQMGEFKDLELEVVDSIFWHYRGRRTQKDVDWNVTEVVWGNVTGYMHGVGDFNLNLITRLSSIEWGKQLILEALRINISDYEERTQQLRNLENTIKMDA